MSGWAFVLMLREVFARTIKAGKPLDGTNLFEQLRWPEGLGFRRHLRRAGVRREAGRAVRNGLQVQRQEQPRLQLEALAEGVRADV